MTLRHATIAVALLCGLIAAGCSKSGGDSAAGDNWTERGHDDTNAHFSPLKDINTSNVDRLGLAYSLDLPGEHSLASTPLEIDGILYFSGQGAAVYAVDAVSGKQLWSYDPETWKGGYDRMRLTYQANRGIAYADGRIFVCSHDGRMIALNAKDGAVLWTAQTFDPNKTRKFSSGHPTVFKDKVVIGNGGGDYGERGYVTAYDQKTGAQVWRFYTAPGKPEENAGDPIMEMAAKTWTGEYWKTGTGGTVWHSMTYDKELNQLYLGTGNSGPYNPQVRSPGGGDNLFLVSIVAVDPDTGKYIWHYQLNPREAWDYKATMDIVLADLDIKGEKRKVLMQAPTNGFFYVIDRKTGKVISAEKTGKVTWADSIDLTTGRPVEKPNIRYENGDTSLWPSNYGSHNWQSMSYSPQTGLVYIPYMQLGVRYQIDPQNQVGGVAMHFLLEDADDGKGKLLAWDPIAQKARWSAPRSSIWNGGVMSTAGDLVFQGTEDGMLEAYDAKDGKKVWSFNAGLGIIATPMTYRVNGKQYVSVLVGYGAAVATMSTVAKGGWKYNAQPRRLLTFALDAKAALPETAPRDFTVAALDDPKLKIDEAAVKRGEALFMGRGVCYVCHGVTLQSTGSPGPDLRESGIALSPDAFKSVLKNGDLAKSGMPRFSEFTDGDVRDLYMYFRAGARESLGTRKPAEKSKRVGGL